MTQSVDTVRRSIEAFNRGEIDTVFELSHPEIEIHDLPELPEAKVFRGIDGLREFLQVNLEPWEDITVEIDELIGKGDQVVMLFRDRVRGRSSQIDFDQPRGAIFTLRDGMVAVVRYYAGPAEALEAAGLPAGQTHS